MMMWRDVFTGCIYLYYNLFCYMEDIGLLDPADEVHIWCLIMYFNLESIPIYNNFMKDGTTNQSGLQITNHLFSFGILVFIPYLIAKTALYKNCMLMEYR
jgi:hypothetical protein